MTNDLFHDGKHDSPPIENINGKGAWRGLTSINLRNQSSKSRRINELNKAAIETAEYFNELEEEK